MNKGMEMLIQTAIKAMGIDPNVLMGKIEEIYTSIRVRLADFDGRLTKIEAQLAVTNELLITLVRQHPELSSNDETGASKHDDFRAH